MKKFLHFDWLRAVQFLGKYSAKKRNSVQISLEIFLRLMYVFSMRMFP